MKFIFNENYPNGSILCTQDDLELIKSKGWTINMHTPYYANYIGIELNGLFLGFSGWLTNLEASFYTPEVGYYNDSWSGTPNIKSQDDLNNFIIMIDCAVKLIK